MNEVDLNCDLGESYGNFKVGRDNEVIPFITSASVGCGFHGGDPSVMRSTAVRRGDPYELNKSTNIQ